MPGIIKPMHRVYMHNADFSSGQIRITDTDELHHVIHVLRGGVGKKMQVFNAQGDMAETVIEQLSEREVLVKVMAVKKMVVVGPRIILACAIPKHSRFDEIVQKTVELGVDEIIPLQTARSEVIISADKAAAKVARFRKIAVAAAKQSGRGHLPVINPSMTVAQALNYVPTKAIKVFPSLHAHPVHVRDVLLNAGDVGCVVIFIGPEGDFTPAEVDMARKAGCQTVTLGATVLRVETAAITTVALARFLLRD